LHVELAEEKKVRQQNEETIMKLERETLEKDSKIRELQYKEEKYSGITLFKKTEWFRRNKKSQYENNFSE